MTSNPGHLLWSNVVPASRAKQVADVLVSEAMSSGYGVRTMATTEGGYNPISYHNGSVWPHDSSIVVAGLARAGFLDHASKICGEMLAALDAYEDDRLPELFAGYAASAYGTPVEYPSANRPQAWASGAVMLLVRSMLGLEVDAIEKHVRVRPFLVEGCDHLEVYDVPIGGDRIDVRVLRKAGVIDVELTQLPSGWTRDG
jgi:glycogen debranching enzyme